MKLKILSILFITAIANFSIAQNLIVDSLKIAIAKGKDDTVKVNTFNNLAIELRKSNLDSALTNGKKGLALATKLKWKKGIGFSNHILGVISYMKDEKTQSMAFNNTALNIWKELSKSLNKSEAAYGKLYVAKTSITNANIYIDQANYSKALEQNFNALRTVEELGDKKVQGIVLGNIGNVYATQRDFPKALEHYNRALQLGSILKEPIFILNQLNAIASCYRQTNDTAKALEYYLKNLKMAEEFGVKQNQAGTIGNIGLIYLAQKRYDAAIINFNKALAIAEEVGDRGIIISNLISLGGTYRVTGKFKEAEINLNKALVLAEEIGETKLLMAIEDNLGNLYDTTGRAALALDHYKKYITYRDSITNQNNRKELFKSEINYEFEKKELSAKAEQDKKDAVAIEEKQQQKMILYFVTIAAVIVVFFSLWIFSRYKISQKQKALIQHQKQIVEEHQKDIIDSITYAKRLQDAILPPAQFINTHIPENFVLYKPKDIVAGDFYWAEHVTANNTDLFFIAAADSTGHGVPGAMVSVVCSNALNRTIKEFKETETGKILDKTRDLVVETFEKSTNEVKDGMDISLLCIDKKNKAIYWSGANNALWFIHNNELTEIKANKSSVNEIKADKQPIGKTENPKPFTTHKIEYKQNTTFYLFTDGLADQFGGPNGKKFKYKQFSDLLLKHSNDLPNEQMRLIDEAFTNWKGDLEQVDDVCIIGIKL